MKLLKVALAFAAGVMASLVWAEDVAPTIEGSVYTFDFEGDGTYSATIPGTCTKVVKKGGGYLKMSGHSVDFHGDVEIQAGVIEAKDCFALGCGKTGTSGWSTPNTITVSSGAQLRATFNGDKSDGNAEGRGFRSILRLAGEGPTYDGAFYYDNDSPSIKPQWIAKEIFLEDDATIGGLSEYSFYNITLNGKRLIYQNDKGSFLVYYCGLVKGPDADGNPGILETDRPLKLFNSPWSGSGADTLKLSGASITFSGAQPIPFAVDWQQFGQGTFEVASGGSDGTKNVFNGDFNFEGTWLLSWPNANQGVTFNGSFYAPNGKLDKGGDGQMFLNGPTNIVYGTFQMSQGGLLFSNNLTNECSYIQLQGTKPMLMRFQDAGTVVLRNQSSSLLRGRYTSADAGVARLEILGKTQVVHPNKNVFFYIGQGATFVTGGGTERCAGKLILGEGVNFQHNLSVGYNGRGAVYAHNATNLWSSESVQYAGMIGGGTAGYGYYGMRGGKLTVPHQLFLGANTDDSTGFFVQRGGETTLQNEFLGISLRGHGNLYVADGGKFTQTAGSSYLGYTDGTMGTGGDGTLTVEGEGSVAKLAWFVGMQNRKDFTSYINVNEGGAIDCAYIVNQSGSGWKWPSGSEEYVSFNGGVWKTSAGEHNLFYTSDTEHVPYFLCQKKGMTIDTVNGYAKANVPIVRPTGKVIKSITLPTDASFLAHPYFGPARITIESTGAGEGATAFAPFDDANERLDGTVKITSPGTGYDAETTVVKVWSMENDQSWDCSFELEDAQDGGVTKLGTGHLKYIVPNTYTGLTCVAEGQLTLDCANAIGDRQDVKIGATGVLAVGADFTFATLGGAGTLQVNSGMQVTVADAFMVDGDLLAAGNKMNVTGSGTFTFATGAKIRPYDAAKFVSAAGPILTAKQINGAPELEGFPDNYALKLNDARTELKLRVKKGLVLLLN